MAFRKLKNTARVDSTSINLDSSDIRQKSSHTPSTKTNLNFASQQVTEYFEWKDVNVSIGNKTILNNVSGRVGNGQLLGILGGSGAGKTTLLNAISGRILNRKPSTVAKLCKCFKSSKEIKVNGTVATNKLSFKLGASDAIKHISAYVMQHDIQCATSTAKEALIFSSKLRSTAPKEQQLETINDVIRSLKLEDCQNTLIGSAEIAGMSGGERKRTAVACELVVNPSLIFLDEPSSGLDSFTALKTLEILKNLVSTHNKKVIAVLHQPSSDIFAMLDVLVILAKGHCIYFGGAMEVVEYFNNLGFLCPQYCNIADYAINRVQENNELFIRAWKENEDKYIDLRFNLYGELTPKESQNSGFWLQSAELLKRELIILKRDPRPSKIRFAQTIIFSLILGMLYYDLPYTAEGLRNRSASLFFLAINSSMTGLLSTISTFPEQRILFERERNNNMYYTTTYILAKILVRIPEQALFTLVYELVCYWLVGFDSTFLQLYISLFLCITCLSSVGMIAGCFANNTTEAMNIMPIALLPLMLMTNFMVSMSQVPVFWRWLRWVDGFAYLLDCLNIMEFQDEEHDCYIDAVGAKHCLYDGNAHLKLLKVGYMDDPFLNQWIQTYDDSVYFDWTMLAILMLFFWLLTWIILVHRNGF